MSLAAQERAALCDRFDTLGPDAPTLAEGWTTHDLALHLYLRDRRPDVMAGIILGGPMRAWGKQVMARLRGERDYADLVGLVRSGPPVLPLGLPGTREAIHFVEFFVHHEDVRRANGDGPRDLPAGMDAELWSRLRLLGPVLLRRVPVGVELVEPTGDVRRARRGQPVVRLRGAPGELMLYAYGRRSAAQVDLEGPADAIERLEAANLRV